MCLLSYGFPKIVVVYTKDYHKNGIRKRWEHLEIPLIKGQRFLLHLRLIYAGDEEKLLRPKLHNGQNQAFFLAITIFCENLENGNCK